MYLTLQNPKTRIQNALKVGWSAILFIALWLGISLSVWAQPQYNMTPVSGTFTPITGGTDVNSIEVDTGLSGVLPIGFTFTYDGIPYTEFKASSNGFITFGVATTSSGTTNDLDDGSFSTNSMYPVLAPLWDDLDGGDAAGAKAAYVLTGTAPNRVLTMEWLNWQWSWLASNPVISFQVKLYESTGVIEYVYNQEAAAVSSASASIGLTSVHTGTTVGFISLSDASAAPTTSTVTETANINTKPANGQIYRWTPALFGLTPSDNTTGIDLDANLDIVFSSGIPAIGTGNIEIKKASDNSVVETITLPSAQVTVTGQTVTINPNTVLDCNTEYYVNVPASAITGVTGFTGITTMTDWSFTTTNACFTLAPADNTTGVATDASPAMTFLFGTPTNGTGTIELRKTTGAVLVESFVLPSPRLSIAGNTVTINPTSVLDCNTEYYITMPATSVNGVGFTGITSATAWSFTTNDPTGIPITPIEYDANITTPLLINDASDPVSTQTITATNTIATNSLRVFVDITHTFMGDIDMTLTHVASGTTIDLSTDNGGLGDNMLTTFDDAAVTSVVGGTAPFTGSVRPEEPLSTFNGLTLDSDWTLTIVDDAGGDDGTLNNWKLLYVPPSVDVNATFTFSPADNATNVAPNSNLVIDFPYPVSAGTGDITVRNASTSVVLETIPVGDARVTFSGGQVTINPTINLPSNTSIAVQFPTGTFQSCNNLNVVGITDNTTWNFNTVNCSSLTINAGADQTANPNTTINLNAVATGAVAGATYSWIPTTGLSNATIANPTIANLTTTTTYTVKVTNPNGCEATDNIILTSSCDALVVSAGTDQSITFGTDVTFAGTVTGATGALTYAWTPTTGLSDPTILNPVLTGFTTPATYTLTVTDAGTGCVKTDDFDITIASSGGGGGGGNTTVTAPSLSITSVNSTSLRLNWTGGDAESYTIYRSTSSFGNNFTRLGQVGSAVATYLDSMLMPNTQYYYYVQATRGSLFENSNRVSDFTYPSAPTVASFQNACIGTGAQFTVRGSTGLYTVYSAATGGTAVATGDSTGVITTPTFADSTTYYISAVGSRYESTPRVAVNVITRPLPTATMLGADLQESCTDSLTIMAEAVEGATYTWYSANSPVATTSTPMYTTNRDGVYSVLVNKDGCVARSNTIRVRVNRVSPAEIRGFANREFCEVGTLEAIQTDSASYEWQRNNAVVGTGSTLEVTESGTYTVTVTSILGCVLTSTPVNVTVITVPQLDLQSSALDFCEGTEGVELSVNSVSGATYEWLRNGRRIRTTSTPSLQVNVGAEYRVRVILNGNCSRTSDPVTVTRNAAPAASVRVYGDSIKVVYVGNVAISSVSWTKDSVAFAATTQAFAPTESGLYVATVTYETGCQVVASGVSYIKPPEPPVVVGEEDVEALGFMLFPNPTASKVNLTFGDAFKGEITLTLTDAIGRTIQVVKVKATEAATIDLSNVANGNYMLTIASDDKVVTRKIIRE
ncbi:Ig-like domain-containing protein [Bernardetia sp. OM2101]|uniref:Ig-like domain-containing protein n=1 Tax=Bernardetia sp. OM2101 TaxID=3344876 RepID=UPI0035CFA72A